MAYGYFKDLAKITTSDKVLRDKAFKIAINPKYDGYQRGLASMVYKFFDKKTKGSGMTTLANNLLLNRISSQLKNYTNQLLENFKKRRAYSSFKDNIWGADLADLQLTSKFNKGIKFLLCVIDIFSKYAWVVTLKDKKGVTVVIAFQKILDDSKRKSNKKWLDKGSEFFNKSMKSWLEKYEIDMY